MAGFILEENKLVFSDDVTIVEDLGAGRYCVVISMIIFSQLGKRMC